MPLKAPFPYFGGKSTIAAEVWKRFGDVPNYVEPFFGSGSMLLCRPNPPQVETVNDADGFISNFWRAVQADPQAVAAAADWPVNENDLHARHLWLVGQRDTMQARLEGDPDWHCPITAGRWVWGMACWIGGEFCSGKGPWQSVDGVMTRTADGEGVTRRLPHLSDAGQGVTRRRPHLSGAGKGVQRQRIRCTGPAYGEPWPYSGIDIYEWFSALQDRLRRVRVCCGDWTRVVTPIVLGCNSPCAVFLDPPYTASAGRDPEIYRVDCSQVGADVAKWAIVHGDDKNLRIAVCGYEGEYEFPPGWEKLAWNAKGGYGLRSDGPGSTNRHRERIWFSPHCLRDVDTPLFAMAEQYTPCGEAEEPE